MEILKLSMTKGELNQNQVNNSYNNILKKLNIKRSEKSLDQKITGLKPNDNIIIKSQKMIKSPVQNSGKRLHKTLDQNTKDKYHSPSKIKLENQNSYGEYEQNLKNPATQKHSIKDMMKKRNEDKYVNLEK